MQQEEQLESGRIIIDPFIKSKEELVNYSFLDDETEERYVENVKVDTPDDENFPVKVKETYNDHDDTDYLN